MNPQQPAYIGKEQSPGASSRDWIDHLKSLIDFSWRPEEFDRSALTFVPIKENLRTNMGICLRPGCGVNLHRGIVCAICRPTWKAARTSGKSVEQWVASVEPRERRLIRTDCQIEGCPRTHQSLGLCRSHGASFRVVRLAAGGDITVDSWIGTHKPQPRPPLDECKFLGCDVDADGRKLLCVGHGTNFRSWQIKHNSPTTTEAEWLSEKYEPPLSMKPLVTAVSKVATLFAELPEPARWELLYAVQARDKTERANLWPHEIRSAYRSILKSKLTSLVGLSGLGMETKDPNFKASVNQWQEVIARTRREWTGVDDRDPRILYIAELELDDNPSRRYGDRAKIDLRGIETPWLLVAVDRYIRTHATGVQEADQIARVWTVADSTIRNRGVSSESLGVSDMDAIVKATRDRWKSGRAARASMQSLERLTEFARLDEDLEQFWATIPKRFAIDRRRHFTVGSTRKNGPRAEANGEPFRFVPQPIVDWLMDHLHLLKRHDEYATAEARAMLYIHERTGRRTGETGKLRDNCISFDSAGSPYLEWERGKPPYTFGPRLPIHQETYDVITQWQEIKKEHGVESKWLFPSRSTRYRHADRHIGTTFLSLILSGFIETVIAEAPYEASVEGVEGNLVQFDLRTIDPYAFRHAFAQRLADATDSDGRPTTPPDVLQSFMDHQSFDTTMAYYEVTAKRRKRTMDSLPARRVNLLGSVVNIDRERDGFTKIAVTLGHCSEPHNVAAGGHGCMIDHACESCPFFLVDPLEREGVEAKRHQLHIQLERARAVGAQQHSLDHYQARIVDCTKIIDGIDRYIATLAVDERDAILEALERMAEIRRRATSARKLDLRQFLRVEAPSG